MRKKKVRDELIVRRIEVLRTANLKSRITGTHEKPSGGALGKLAGFSLGSLGSLGHLREERAERGGPVRDQVGHEIAQEANQRAHARERTGG